MRGPISREDLGGSIAEVRVRIGLTQEQLGDLTGLGQTVVSRIESGQRRVESLELLSIARALGVDLDELLAAAEAQSAPDPTEDVRRLALRLQDRDPASVQALDWVGVFFDRLAHLEELNRA